MSKLHKVPSIFRFSARWFSTLPKRIETVESERVEYFETLKDAWWDQNGSFKMLTTLNQVRVPFIKETVVKAISKNNAQIDENLPFKNLNILDVGCGGGLLSEQLAKLGGNVTAIDPSKELIDVAKTHAKLDSNLTNLNYACQTLEDHVAIHSSAKYDLVVMSQVLFHVTNWQVLLNTGIECIKPGGSLIITSSNKTLKARLYMWYYENLTGLMPKGTLQYEKFTPLEELKTQLRENNCEITGSTGYRYSILKNKWRFDSNLQVAFIIHAKKN